MYYKKKMGLRPAKCYHWDSPAYTRTAGNPQDSFIVGIPGTKISSYERGNLKAKFELEFSIVPQHRIQVRHNSLEAVRVAINKIMEKKVGLPNYKFKIRVFPHHVMRENVMATGAGADRVQSGMRDSFGKPIGRAARLNKGQPIISLYVNKNEETLKITREALKTGISKLPGDMRIVVKELK